MTRLGPSAHMDTFARDNLPRPEQWPDILPGPIDYPERLNVGVELSDRMVQAGFGDHVALIGHGRRRTYKELTDWTNRLAHALREDFGVKPGNRVLIRSANNPAMVGCWLAATKAGAVVVNTMPMLRAGELAKIVEKARIRLALCDTRMMDELVACSKTSRFLDQVIGFDGTANHDAELDRIALTKPVRFEAVATGRDDVALLAFTSGTTGEPKATMHFHRDLLAIADGYAKEVLGVTPGDVFVGSPPLAFTFGLGGLAIFPLRFGATAALLEEATPQNMVDLIERHKASIVFTAPTAYRAMLDAMDDGADLSSLRLAVSAGETLPRAGLRRLDLPDGQAHPGRHRHHRAPAHLHLESHRQRRSRLHRRAGDGLRGAHRRGARRRAAARRGRTPCGPRTHRLPLPRRRAAGSICPRGLELHRRRLPAGRARPVSFCGAPRRHDPVGRLQHRRARDRGRRCLRTRTWPSARWSARPMRNGARSSWHTC